jgi:hypothetical protein
MEKGLRQKQMNMRGSAILTNHIITQRPMLLCSFAIYNKLGAMLFFLFIAILLWAMFIYFAYINWCRSGGWPRIQGIVIGHEPRGLQRPNDQIVVDVRHIGEQRFEARIALDDTESLTLYPVGKAVELAAHPRRPGVVELPRPRSAFTWSVVAVVLYPVFMLGLAYAVRA